MSNETLESVNDLEILENIWRRQDAEEILVENMTDEEFYSYREKMYGIPAPIKSRVFQGKVKDKRGQPLLFFLQKKC